MQMHPSRPGQVCSHTAGVQAPTREEGREVCHSCAHTSLSANLKQGQLQVDMTAHAPTREEGREGRHDLAHGEQHVKQGGQRHGCVLGAVAALQGGETRSEQA